MRSHSAVCGILLAALLPMLQIPNLTTQREIKAEIEIQAPPESVWKVLTDLATYPIWNPYIYPARGEIRPGAQLEITLHEGKTVTYRPTVLSVEANRELSWGGRFAGMFERILTITLEPIDPADPHGTRLVARELFRGLLLLAVGGMPDDARHGLDLMNRALRERAELLLRRSPQHGSRQDLATDPDARAK